LALGPACGAPATATSTRAAARTPTTEVPSKAVHLRVAVSGDLLIHSPIFNRAKALGGGRRYELPPR
jgi:hypothetical protein